MADLNDLQSALTTKIAGASTSGLETNYADVDVNGNLQVGGLPIGATNETAPGTDTAASGLNGRLQRIAQRLTSLISLIPTAVGTAFYTRISNGTNVASVTANQDLSVQDGLSGGGLDGALSVPTANTAIEVKVGGSRLANRKYVSFQATSHDFYWGFSNAVTTSTGELIKKGATARWAVDPTGTAAQFWVVCAHSSASGRVKESP